jgi:hypothetical protein
LNVRIWGLNGLSRSKPAILRCVVLLDHSWEKANYGSLGKEEIVCSTSKKEFLRLFAAQARKKERIFEIVLQHKA